MPLDTAAFLNRQPKHDYYKVTVPQLKALLKEHNIKCKANKEIMVNALIDKGILGENYRSPDRQTPP
jgi:hypothetical protein